MADENAAAGMTGERDGTPAALDAAETGENVGTSEIQVANEGGGTGDSRVDAAVARLGELADAPLDEHPAILEQVHDRLREVLGELSPGMPGTPGAAAGAPGAPT
ncbi:MAG TPA: hypothetical protein VE733_04940 [Streptosporangiaceae bacterium]|jgi:hypothetical protein|nr:hypothetical protein [Streptosporangiaceae bacterium]